MTIKGMVFDEKKAAGERLMLACMEMPNADMMLLGTYRGFELNIRFDSFKNEHVSCGVFVSIIIFSTFFLQNCSLHIIIERTAKYNTF